VACTLEAWWRLKQQIADNRGHSGHEC
jgi:hypothetical protein